MPVLPEEVELLEELPGEVAPEEDEVLPSWL